LKKSLKVFNLIFHFEAVGLHPMDFMRLSGDTVGMKGMRQLLKRIFVVLVLIALVAVAGLGWTTRPIFTA
jgi:hypothetical protein